ncbi:MAG: MFS transporter [Acidimicrobiales bacterium]
MRPLAPEMRTALPRAWTALWRNGSRLGSEMAHPRTTLGRLSRMHALMLAGDTAVTVSLAGTLFFSISPTAARSQILAYLAFTMAPFAIVAPLLGPLSDRYASSRSSVALASGLARVLLALALAVSLRTWLLFPEALGILVASKLYLVNKSALVPRIITSTGAEGQRELVHCNARLTLVGSLAGAAVAVPAWAAMTLAGARWSLVLSAAVYAGGVVAASHLQLPTIGRSSRSPGQPGEPPAQAAGGQPARATTDNRHRPNLAFAPMAVLRAMTGFFVFVIAFQLRAERAATWWYGLMLVATAAGSLAATQIAPRARSWLMEDWMLLVTTGLVGAAGVTAALVGGKAIEALVAFSLGLASSGGKMAFDALAQRDVPVGEQGRGFARYEAGLQLAWVIGALISVAAFIPERAGDMLIASTAAATGLAYLLGRQAMARLGGA